MDQQMILELVGYFASLLVLVSLLMSSAVKLHIINGIGSLIFAVYAVLIRSYPTAVMNFCLVGIDAYFLYKLLRNKTLLHFQYAGTDEQCVAWFLTHYRSDIARYFPDVDAAAHEGETVCVAFAGGEIAGILLGTREGSKLRVRIDYAAPAYRDCSVGRCIYAHLASDGVTALCAEKCDEKHAHYLEKMGFVEKNDTFVKTL